MEKFPFFIAESLWNMAGLLIVILGVAQLLEWAAGKQLPILSGKVKLLIAFLALEWGQYGAFNIKNQEISESRELLHKAGDALVLSQGELRKKDDELRNRPLQLAPPQINVQVPPTQVQVVQVPQPFQRKMDSVQKSAFKSVCEKLPIDLNVTIRVPLADQEAQFYAQEFQAILKETHHAQGAINYVAYDNPIPPGVFIVSHDDSGRLATYRNSLQEVLSTNGVPDVRRANGEWVPESGLFIVISAQK